MQEDEKRIKDLRELSSQRSLNNASKEEKLQALENEEKYINFHHERLVQEITEIKNQLKKIAEDEVFRTYCTAYAQHSEARYELARLRGQVFERVDYEELERDNGESEELPPISKPSANNLESAQTMGLKDTKTIFGNTQLPINHLIPLIKDVDWQDSFSGKYKLTITERNNEKLAFSFKETGETLITTRNEVTIILTKRVTSKEFLTQW